MSWSSRDEDPARRLTLFFSIGRDFVDDGEGGWEMVEDVMPSCAEGDGLGGVAETEGAREQREEKPQKREKGCCHCDFIQSVTSWVWKELGKKKRTFRLFPLLLPVAFCIFS